MCFFFLLQKKEAERPKVEVVEVEEEVVHEDNEWGEQTTVSPNSVRFDRSVCNILYCNKYVITLLLLCRY